MEEKILQESWNKTTRESRNERWHVYFKSSPVFPLRVSSVLTISFGTPQHQQREASGRGVRTRSGGGASRRCWRALPRPPSQPGTAAACPQCHRITAGLSPRRAGPWDGAGLPRAQLRSPALASHRRRRPRWARGCSGPQPPGCLAGRGRAALQAGLYLQAG